MKPGHGMRPDHIPPGGSRMNDLAGSFTVNVLSFVLELQQ
jgi:hypothetical protein